MEQPHNASVHIKPQVVLSQPAKAVSTVEPAPRPPYAPNRKDSTVPALRKQKRSAGGRSKRLLKVLGLLVLTVCVALGSVGAFVALGGESLFITKVYQDALPSVVLITSEFPGQTPGQETDSGTGSGVIVRLEDAAASQPLIVTNAHVVQGASRITVTLHSGQTLRAKLVGLDENTDLAVLQVEAKHLPAVKFASAGRMKRLRAGETAIVIGNPLGAELADTMTVGIISATRRGVEVGSTIVEMLQTDASVSPGNSGGPMLDTGGRIIGIITSKVIEDGAEGIGFALPADLAKRIVTELAVYGSVVSRPMMGITVQAMDQEAVDYYKETFGEIYEVGIIVKEINEGNNAWKAGLRVGDKVLQFDGYEVKTVHQVNYLKEQHRIGDTVTMTVERNGEKIEMSFQLEGTK